jgi:hypothetical protein
VIDVIRTTKEACNLRDFYRSCLSSGTEYRLTEDPEVPVLDLPPDVIFMEVAHELGESHGCDDATEAVRALSVRCRHTIDRYKGN